MASNIAAALRQNSREPPSTTTYMLSPTFKPNKCRVLSQSEVDLLPIYQYTLINKDGSNNNGSGHGVSLDANSSLESFADEKIHQRLHQFNTRSKLGAEEAHTCDRIVSLDPISNSKIKVKSMSDNSSGNIKSSKIDNSVVEMLPFFTSASPFPQYPMPLQNSKSFPKGYVFTDTKKPNSNDSKVSEDSVASSSAAAANDKPPPLGLRNFSTRSLPAFLDRIMAIPSELANNNMFKPQKPGASKAKGVPGNKDKTVTAAKEKKAAHKAEVDKQKSLEKEREIAQEWSKGAKRGGKKEEQEAKRAEKLAKKKEAQDLLKDEEKVLSKISGKGGSVGKKIDRVALPTKKSPSSSGVSTPIRGAEKAAAKKQAAHESKIVAQEPVEEFAARNIDDAIELMDSVSLSKGGADNSITQARIGASLGETTTAAAIDRHPERRAKAAYRAYEDRMMMKLKEENPGLRLSQLKQLIFKEWQKAPENPFNQIQVAYNAKQAEIDQVVDNKRQNAKDRLRV
ncbi:hypothetical protein H4219_005487 [Mycoemilia scoparia]|uniref:HMG box domain-containing protein n=1 Tax=Mycoemilia scoparia TaxID=417184 RepID=A0A9W8DL05_9FUNG|nr:hypothetical protein H4219_005487 [Mycoemilia scoparia]